MRDGVHLAADIYRPDVPGKLPVIVVRVPYDKDRFGRDAERGYGHYFARHGYVVVIQDTRGRFESEGEFSPLVDEANDGYDTVEWAARLPWSNGRVGTAGQSYYAANQYLLAPTNPPHLVACAPISAPSDWSESWVYRTGGVLELGWLLPYAIIGLGFESARRRGATELLRLLASDFGLDAETFLAGPGLVPLVPDAYLRLPVVAWADALREIAPYLHDYFTHVEDADYWRRLSIREQHDAISTPMYHVGSWYDLFLEGTLANFEGIRGSQKMLIGPWVHRPLSDPYTRPSSTAGEADFGPEAAVELLDVLRRWFDHWLKDDDTGIMDEPPVSVFVMGAGRWRHLADWPPPDADYTRLYLRDGGRLSWEPPADEPPDAYTFDPADPTPTLGGSTIALANGAYDQRPIELRADVLVYTSDVLERPLEVTGPLTATLFAASSCMDTDFVVRLVDVFPDGYSRNIQDGVVRARYRDGRSSPRLMRPGQAYELRIDLWATSYLFQAGHRIRVHVSSSSFPRFDRNLNVAEHPLWSRDWERARQTVYHDRVRPSHIVLPLVS